MNIVAIGGGDMGGGQTLSMDQEFVSLTGATDPHILFLPTATEDDLEYIASFERTFGMRLGCKTDSLLLWEKHRKPEVIRKKIEAADGIYVGGGNTKAMISLWRELGVDLLLKEHVAAGKPVCGVSAGAICWFRKANSDWPQYEGIPGVNTASLDCLGFVDLVVCPHTRDEGFRLAEFKAMLRESGDLGIGLDDVCALQVRGDEYRILAAEPFAFAHRIWWEGDEVREELILPHADFRPLELLRQR